MEDKVDKNSSGSGFRITPQIALGVIIVVVGLLFTLDNLDVLRARDYLRYWPVLLIIYGVVKMSQPRGMPGRLAGLIFALVGTALFLDKLELLSFRVWDYWPLIIVLIGGTMIWRAFTRQTSIPGRSLGREWLSDSGPGAESRKFGPADAGQEAAFDSDTTVSGVAVLGGVRRSNTSQDFKGGELTAIMGGCEIDLREASIKSGEAVIDVFAFWGGIDIKVPNDWSVVVLGTPLMGGFDDKTRPPQGGSNKRLVVKGYAIMGGVEISN
jgi:predicted membrane protein